MILRDVNATVERNGRNEVIGRAILNSIERFWLCIMRWQYLQTLGACEGVRGARRGTRILDVAKDLNVPGELATMYRYAKGVKYLWYPPASVDLKVAERESNHKYPELWPWVLEKEGNLGREDIVLDVEDDEVEGEIDEDIVEEKIVKEELDDVIELSD